MTLILRDDLYWCICSGRPLFLDIAEDRYFCLAEPIAAAFRRIAAGGAQPGDAALLGTLVERGMVIEVPGLEGIRPTPLPDRATGDLFEEPLPPPGLSHVLGALRAALQTGWMMRRKPLLEILNGTARPSGRRHPPLPSSLDGLAGIVAASSRAALFFGATDRCLARALALYSVCRRKGIEPMLVFGVRIDPFTAHCWVQLGDKVLIGDFEQVRLFEPIAAFG